MPDIEIVELTSDDEDTAYVIVQPSNIPGVGLMVFKGPRDWRGWNLAAMGSDSWKVYTSRRQAERALRSIQRQQKQQRPKKVWRFV